MRWAQFLLTLVNLVFAIYILVLNLVSPDVKIRASTFSYSLIYLALAVALCHLYLLYMVNKVDDWYDEKSINSISNLAIFCVVLCTIGLLIYIQLEYMDKKTLTMIFNDGGPLRHPIIPLTALLLSSVVLFCSSIKFKKYVTLCRSVDSQPQLSVSRIPNYRTTELSAWKRMNKKWISFQWIVSIEN